MCTVFINFHKHWQAGMNMYGKTKKEVNYFVCLQDYELQLASYSSGLETLLNIPIKRTMLQSPASVVRQEV